MIYSAPRQGLFLLIISVSFCLNTALVMVSTENQVEKNRIQKGERLVAQLIDESALALAYEDRVSLSVIARRYTQEYDVNRIVIRDVNEEPLVQVGEAPLKAGVVIDELATRNHKVIGRVEMVLMPTTMSEIAKMIWLIIVGSFFFHLMLWLAYEKIARPTKEQLRSLSREIQTYYFPDHHYLDPIEEQLRIAKQEEELELELVRLRELEHQLEEEHKKVTQREQALAQSQLHIKQLEENQERLLSNKSNYESGHESSNNGSNQQNSNENNEQIGNKATAKNQTVPAQPDYLSEKIDPTITPKTTPKTTSKTKTNTEQASVQDIVFHNDEATNNKANNGESNINNTKITSVTKPIASSILKATDGAKHKISELFAKIPVANHKQTDSTVVNDGQVNTKEQQGQSSKQSDKLQQMKQRFLGKYDKYLGKQDKQQDKQEATEDTDSLTTQATTTQATPKPEIEIEIETKTATAETKKAVENVETTEIDLDNALDSRFNAALNHSLEEKVTGDVDLVKVINQETDTNKSISQDESIAADKSEKTTIVAGLSKDELVDDEFVEDEFAHGKFKYAMAVDSTASTANVADVDFDIDTDTNTGIINDDDTQHDVKIDDHIDDNRDDNSDELAYPLDAFSESPIEPKEEKPKEEKPIETQPNEQPSATQANDSHISRVHLSNNHSGRRSINDVFKKHSISEELSAFLSTTKQVSSTIDSPIHVKANHIKDDPIKADLTTESESLSATLSESPVEPKQDKSTESATKPVAETLTKPVSTDSTVSPIPPISPAALEKSVEPDIPKGFFSRRNPLSASINASINQSSQSKSALTADLLQVQISFVDKYSLLSKLSPDMANSYLQLCSELLQQASIELLKLPMLDGISLVNQAKFNQQGAVIELKSIPTPSSEQNQLALAGLMLGALYKMLNEIIYEKHREVGQFALTVAIGISQAGRENAMQKLLKTRAADHDVLMLLAKAELKYIERYIRVKRISTPNNVSERECVYVKAINNELLKKIIKVRNSVLEAD